MTTTIKLIATGTVSEREELKNKIRWLEIGAIQREYQRAITRDFYSGARTKSFLTVNPSLACAPEFTLEDAVQRYKCEQDGVVELVTVCPDARFGSVFTQDIETRLSPYALMEEFNDTDKQPTFLRLLGKNTVELYGNFELAKSKLGPETVAGAFKPDYRWFDKRDAIKTHHP